MTVYACPFCEHMPDRAEVRLCPVHKKPHLSVNRAKAALARLKVDAAMKLLQEALGLVSEVAPTGHDATHSVYEAKRCAEVAEAKLAILERRVP